jgi:hypothetical protein
MSALLVRDIAKEAFADAVEMLSIIETLEAGNEPATIAAVNAARTGAVAMYVNVALWSRLILIVSRAYAEKPRPNDRHAQHAFELLKDPALKSQVEQSGDRSKLDEAIALWTKCRADHRRQAIHDFRDKQVAHWGVQQSAPPIINDIFAVTRATAAALERLAQGTGIVTLSTNSQLMGYRDDAKRFWRA